MSNPIPRRLARALRTTADLLLVCLLTLIAANLAAWLLLATSWFAAPPPGPLAADDARIPVLYPEMPADDVAQLLAETWSRRYVYEAFTQFKEGAYSGRFLNVDEAGFRPVEAGQTWPPPEDGPVVFVFGGSTTFGYGLADGQTIPAQLAERLSEGACGEATAVYNFGRSNYFSSQERALFERLALAGHLPDMAIFVDGLNEFGYPDGEPKFTRTLERRMSEGDGRIVYRALTTMPLSQLVLRLVQNRAPVPPEMASEEAVEIADRVLARWRRNRRLTAAAAAELDVATLFVWQPVPVYRYDLGQHPFYAGEGPLLADQAAIVRGYARMEKGRAGLGGGPAASRFLWLGDLQRGRDEPLYVDRVHYTAAFARQIALAIGPVVEESLCAR